MTPTERGIALAVEAVPGVARLHALRPTGGRGDEDHFAFLVELRPYRGKTIAEVHYAIMRIVGRRVAARVTYGNADAPSPRLLQRARELSLTTSEREIALHECATRILPVEDEPPPPTAEPFPLTVLIIDVDSSTANTVKSVARPTDAITDSGFGMPLRALVDVAVNKQYDLIFSRAPSSRRSERAALAGWRFFLEVLSRDPSLRSLFVFVNAPDEVLTEPARRMNLLVLTKPLEVGAVRGVLEAARARLRPNTLGDAPTVAEPRTDGALTQYWEDVAALRAKGGIVCERLADLLEQALNNPEAYAAALRDKAEQEGSASARAIPTTTMEILELLHDTARTLLSM